MVSNLYEKCGVSVNGSNSAKFSKESVALVLSAMVNSLKHAYTSSSRIRGTQTQGRAGLASK